MPDGNTTDKKELEDRILELIKQYEAKIKDEVLIVKYEKTASGYLYYVRVMREDANEKDNEGTAKDL